MGSTVNNKTIENLSQDDEIIVKFDNPKANYSIDLK